MRDTSEPREGIPMRKETRTNSVKRSFRRFVGRPTGGFPPKEKIGKVVEGLHGWDSVATLYRKEGLAQNLYYR
jgi:hypothetical protein